jgi:hypothetical protein
VSKRKRKRKRVRETQRRMEKIRERERRVSGDYRGSKDEIKRNDGKHSFFLVEKKVLREKRHFSCSAVVASKTT